MKIQFPAHPHGSMCRWRCESGGLDSSPSLYLFSHLATARKTERFRSGRSLHGETPPHVCP